MLESLKAASRTTCGGFFFLNNANFVYPVHDSDKFTIHIDIPIVVNTAFLQHIQIRVRSPGHVNVFQWDWECFLLSARGVELQVRRDGDKWYLLPSTRSHCGLQRSSFASVGWDLSEFPWGSSLTSSLLTGCSLLGVDSRTSKSLPDNFAVPSAIGKKKMFTPFGLQHFFRIEPSSMDFWRVQILQLLDVCNQNISFPDFLPRDQYVSEEYAWQDLLTKLVEPWLVFCRNRMRFNHRTERYDWASEWFSKSPLTRCLPICHWISPPFFIQAQWAIQQTSFLLFFIPLFQQYHSSQIDEVSTFDDSMLDLSRDLPNSKELSVWMTFGFSDGSKNFLELLSVQ